MSFHTVPLVHPTAVSVSYTVRSNESPCVASDVTIPSINVTVTCGSTALQVMQAAVDQANQDVSQSYRFRASYFGNTTGYRIGAINDVPEIFDEVLVAQQCTWMFLVQTPEGEISLPSAAVSNYTFKDDGYGMMMVLYSEQSSPIANGTNSTSTPGTCSGTLGSIVATKSTAWHTIVVILALDLLALVLT